MALGQEESTSRERPEQQFAKEVFPAECDHIQRRWRRVYGDQVADQGRRLHADEPTARNGLVGLALSGGGIRSATFNLGIVQQLSRRGVFEHIDYLSTVSGGGYIGSSLSCLMRGGKRMSELDGWPLVRHYHGHSNYLGPKGLGPRTAGMLLRGLIYNLILFLPLLFLLALALTRVYPDLGDVSRLRLTLTLWAFLAWVLVTPVLALVYWIAKRTRRRFRPSLLPRLRELTEELVAGFLVLALAALLVDLSTLPVPFFGSQAFWAAVVLAVLGLGLGVASPLVRGIALPALGGMILYLPFLAMLRWLAGIRAVTPEALVPDLLLDPATSFLGKLPLASPPTGPLLATSLLGLLVLVYLWLYWSSNVNLSSMHGFYRDALGRAFLIDPAPADDGAEAATLPHRKKDFEPAGDLRLSDLLKGSSLAPYHLLNTALNLQGNSEDLSRGRSADFFVLSPRFIGGDRTGYCRTNDMEGVHPKLDLAAATAISGAAATANMGRYTNKALVFPMTMLNIRLGNWVPNPARVRHEVTADGKPRAWRPRAYLILREMLSALHERGRSVYLSDGGHLDNTGIYELLRRRCKYIIAGDAEADYNMTFDGLVRLILYARLDLGIEIEIMAEDLYLRDGLSRHHGALGRIIYPSPEGAETGWLLYIKASLTGDEEPVIRGYANRSPLFPHEPTADQFFDEGQFEAYRTLGLHAAGELLPPRLESFEELESWFYGQRQLLDPSRPPDSEMAGATSPPHPAR